MPRKTTAVLDPKQTFLLLFTRELIINSRNRVVQLEKIIESEEKEGKVPKTAPTNEPKNKPVEGVKNVEKQEPLIKSILSTKPRPPVMTHLRERPKEGLAIVKPVNIKTPRREIHEAPKRLPSQILRIPEPNLPEEFRYLKPTPTARDINLGKLNPLIYDKSVQTIECEGPDRPIIVSGRMGRKPTNISLPNEEIENIIQSFSEASKIPAETGVYKVVVGRFIFSAVISDVVPSRFMIRKMYAPNLPQRPYPRLNPNYQLFFRK